MQAPELFSLVLVHLWWFLAQTQCATSCDTATPSFLHYSAARHAAFAKSRGTATVDMGRSAKVGDARPRVRRIPPLPLPPPRAYSRHRAPHHGGRGRRAAGRRRRPLPVQPLLALLRPRARCGCGRRALLRSRSRAQGWRLGLQEPWPAEKPKGSPRALARRGGCPSALRGRRRRPRVCDSLAPPSSLSPPATTRVTFALAVVAAGALPPVRPHRMRV